MTTQGTIPPELQHYTWRPYRREDTPALYQTLIDVDRADNLGSLTTLEDMHKQYDDPWSNPETDSLLAFTADGQVAAMARVFANPEPVDERRAHLWGEVHPQQRGNGLEDFVLAWMEARGRAKLQEQPEHLPGLLRVGAQDDLRERIAVIERHGFAPVRYFYRMRRDLHQSIPPVTLPDGLTLCTYRSELDRSMFEAFNASFADHWSFEPVTEQEWLVFFVGRSDFCAALTFLALEGDQVVGFSLNTLNPESNARQGLQEGWIAELGVRRAWRKRGVASALLCASMHAMQAAGLDWATLGVDTTNPTGALRLYERLGFAQVKRFISFQKNL